MGLRIAGRTIEDPMPIWREYARSFPRTIREYDRGDRGDPNHVTCMEAWTSRIIRSRISRHECEEIAARASEPGCPWHDVPADASLLDADPAVHGGLFDKAAALYWHFTSVRIHGVRVAKVHKILHPKRPALYPILDGKVKELYQAQAGQWVERLGRLEVTIQDSPPYWAAIREDLVHNQRCLEAYREKLATDADGTVALMAPLTNLRLQDIVAWSISQGRSDTEART